MMVSCVLLLAIALIIILVHLDWKWQVSITYLQYTRTVLHSLRVSRKVGSAVVQIPIWCTAHRICPIFYQCNIPTTYCKWPISTLGAYFFFKKKLLDGRLFRLGNETECLFKKHKKLKTTEKCQADKFLKIYYKRSVTKILLFL